MECGKGGGGERMSERCHFVAFGGFAGALRVASRGPVSMMQMNNAPFFRL